MDILQLNCMYTLTELGIAFVTMMPALAVTCDLLHSESKQGKEALQCTHPRQIYILLSPNTRQRAQIPEQPLL